MPWKRKITRESFENELTQKTKSKDNRDNKRECILEDVKSDRTQQDITAGCSGRKTKRTNKPTKQQGGNDELNVEVDNVEVDTTQHKVTRNKVRKSKNQKVASPDEKISRVKKQGRKKGLTNIVTKGVADDDLNTEHGTPNENTDDKVDRDMKHTSKRKRPAKTLVKEEESSVVVTKKGKVKVDKGKRFLREDKSDIIEKKLEVKGSDVAGKIVESRKSMKKGMTKCIGAHVSISGGLYRAVDEAVAMGANAFGMFLKSQRQWASKPLTDPDATKFKEACQANGYPPHLILPHGSYLMNCGSPNEETLQKSRNALVDELQRCEKLGLTLFNFHPGSTCGEISVEESLNRIAESINMAHSKTKYVIAVLENMCCQGNTVGGKFEELREIIKQVKDKSRIGVCLDTCHAFAAGHNLSTEDGVDAMLKEFDDVVGLKYLKALHLNDSKGKVGCHLDRHENIGKGYIGKLGFQKLMNDSRLDNIPMILETPCPQDNTYALEVKMLYSMCKK